MLSKNGVNKPEVVKNWLGIAVSTPSGTGAGTDPKKTQLTKAEAQPAWNKAKSDWESPEYSKDASLIEASITKFKNKHSDIVNIKKLGDRVGKILFTEIFTKTNKYANA